MGFGIASFVKGLLDSVKIPVDLSIFSFQIPFEYLYIFLVGFIVTFAGIYFLKDYFKAKGWVAKDRHKFGQPDIPLFGDIPIFIGFMVAFIVALDYLKLANSEMIAILSVLFLCVVIGFIDYFIKPKDYQKFLLLLLIGVPLIIFLPALGTGITMPYFGTIEFGIIYYFVLIPIAFMGAANAMNMLAGLNGLEVGNAIIAVSGLTILLYLRMSPAFLLGIIYLGPLLAFLYFNKYPSKIFFADIGTFFMGGIIALMAILGNVEFFAMLMIAPQFLEFVLKLRSNFKAENFAYVDDNEILHLDKYKHCYSLTHVFYKEAKYNEKSIVYRLWFFQGIFVFLALALYIWGG